LQKIAGSLTAGDFFCRIPEVFDVAHEGLLRAKGLPAGIGNGREGEAALFSSPKPAVCVS
jgi:hypothetical protein